jgi:1-acyl-sn-glycerol-3-phosphate acyltransferase
LLNALEILPVTLLLYLLSFAPGADKSAWYRKLFRYWCQVFTRVLGVDLHLHQHNREALPQQFIMIANHPSAFEDIGLPALFDVTSLAKAEVRDWWILGRISTAAGTLYVKRESRKSRASALQQLIEHIKHGESVALYPEGGCMGKRLHERFFYGAFEASLQTGVPIVPVFIHYEAQDDFYWAPRVLLIKKMWQILRARNNRANFHVFDAFYPKDFNDKQQYCQQVYDQYLLWQSRYLD